MNALPQNASSGLANKAALARFILLTSLSGVGIGLAKMTTALYALSLEATPLELGLIASAQIIGLLLASLPCGLLVERFGALRLYLTGSLLAALTCQLLPLIAHPLYLMLMSLLLGLCMPCRLVALNAVFMQQLPKLKPSRAGWLRGAQMIGLLLIGPPLAASIYAALGPGGSWPLIGVVFAAPMLLAPFVLNIYPGQRRQAERLSLAALGRQLSLLRDQPALRANGLLDFGVQASAQFFSFFIVAITLQGFGWSAHQAACLVTAHGLSFIGALFCLGRVLAQYPRAGRLISLLLCALALLILGLTQQAALLWLAALLLGLSLGMLQVITLSRYAEQGTALGHGRVAGLAVLVGPAGSLSGCLLGGLLGGLAGLQALFLLFVPLFLSFAAQPLWPSLQPIFSFRRTFR